MYNTMVAEQITVVNEYDDTGPMCLPSFSYVW